MPPLSVMFKTVSTDCNLDCGYCYYRESLEGSRVRRRVEWSMLEQFMPQYMAYIADSGAASFAWQGGEPTLAGVQFFRDVVALQARHARPGTTISNALQTNATLITEEWAGFLAEYNFLVGVSVDGPRDVHDLLRKDRGGHGSFDRVMAGLDLIRRNGIDLNVLCVVGPHNVMRARDLMRFFRREGITHLQFIPAMDFQAMEPLKPPAYLISPEEYGEFLVELFDQWYGTGAPEISIRIFNNFLQSFLGMANDLCVHGDTCDAGIVVEYNGDVYPCDFYIHPEWKLGNVFADDLSTLCESPQRAAFVAQKQPLPALCQACEYKAWCKGGCPRNRLSQEDGSDAPDYFCAGYKRLFGHGQAKLAHLRDRLTNRFRYLEQIELVASSSPPGRNEECLCGSGKKHKACCGEPVFADSYLNGTT
jgi:uncharacterized protein